MGRSRFAPPLRRVHARRRTPITEVSASPTCTFTSRASLASADVADLSGYWPAPLPITVALVDSVSQDMVARGEPELLNIPATLPLQLRVQAPLGTPPRVQSEWFPKAAVC